MIYFFLDRVQYEILGSRVADLSTNEIDLNMGLDLGLCIICDHILLLKRGEFFLNIGGEIICFQNNHSLPPPPDIIQLARPLRVVQAVYALVRVTPGIQPVAKCW